MTTVLAPICVYYIHVSKDKNATVWGCDAFPGGIPEKFVMSEAYHTSPEPGDNGIQFELDAEALAASRRAVGDASYVPSPLVDAGIATDRAKASPFRRGRATIAPDAWDEAETLWEESVPEEFRTLLADTSQ